MQQKPVITRCGNRRHLLPFAPSKIRRDRQPNLVRWKKVLGKHFGWGQNMQQNFSITRFGNHKHHLTHSHFPNSEFEHRTPKPQRLRLISPLKSWGDGQTCNKNSRLPDLAIVGTCRHSCLPNLISPIHTKPYHFFNLNPIQHVSTCQVMISILDT